MPPRFLEIEAFPDRFRVSSWADIEAASAARDPDDESFRRYGIEARIGPRRWVHCAYDGTAILYGSRAEAACEVERLNRLLEEGKPLDPPPGAPKPSEDLPKVQSAHEVGHAA